MRITQRDLERGIKFLTEDADASEIFGSDTEYIENIKKVLPQFIEKYPRYEKSVASMILQLADVSKHFGGLNSFEFDIFMQYHPRLYLTQGARNLVCMEAEES
jgi:hypothetical protein